MKVSISLPDSLMVTAYAILGTPQEHGGMSAWFQHLIHTAIGEADVDLTVEQKAELFDKLFSPRRKS